MKSVKWGIIGCGDVAEIKSGPAFQLAGRSELVGVMRRNQDKARDFAQRHKVPFWTNKADELLQHPEVNAIYIATPPSTHLAYTLTALEANKNVYLEKPMALSTQEAHEISRAVSSSKGRLTVAHYRRRLPAFLKVKELLEEGGIGNILFADIQILQPRKSDIIAITEGNWRLNPDISGGGYFWDLAPHQIDLMYHYFGSFDKVSGFSTFGKNNRVEETVNGIIHFKNGIQFRGVWNFTAAPEYSKEECTIYGTSGTIRFSFYGESVEHSTAQGDTVFTFDNPKHIQQPMIQEVVNYFLGYGPNPCSAGEGLKVMMAMEKLSCRSGEQSN